ncbi:MAG: hypothetical protein ACWGO1_11520 [Anaerolineales bacterium]
MSIALAATWNPRGEMPRLLRLLQALQRVYYQVVIVSPPDADLSGSGAEEVRQAGALPGIHFFQSAVWAGGRYTAILRAHETEADYIQYADLDRLLRWVETRPEEWQNTVNQILLADCMVIGRTPACYRTHPKALIQTEALSNRVVSHFLGRQMDVSAGSKGFSRGAARYVIDNTSPDGALGTDARWPILLHRAGFRVDYIEVDGLDWESADRYLDRAASPGEQRLAAEIYDGDPENWSQRVDIAHQIIQAAFESSGKDEV